MNTYISLNEVLVLAQKALDCHLKQVPRKKILFQGIVNTGETLTLCSPLSKMHPQGFYWVDITEEQARVLNETDTGLLFFRLEGRNLLMIKWTDLKQYLTDACVRYNANEQYHWKLNIYKDHIKISGNANEIPVELMHYTSAE